MAYGFNDDKSKFEIAPVSNVDVPVNTYYFYDGSIAHARRWGNVVHVSVGVGTKTRTILYDNNAENEWKRVATLPEGYRPPEQVSITTKAESDGGSIKAPMIKIHINTGGRIDCLLEPNSTSQKEVDRFGFDVTYVVE